jgi:transcriptional regulator with XRE-family HTH domain
MTDLEERIREVMGSTGWKTAAEVAKVAGVSRAAVAQWLGGVKDPAKVVNSIKLEPAMKLEAATRYSALWIARGEGPKFRPNVVGLGAGADCPFRWVNREEYAQLDADEKAIAQNAMQEKVTALLERRKRSAA